MHWTDGSVEVLGEFTKLRMSGELQRLITEERHKQAAGFDDGDEVSDEVITLRAIACTKEALKNEADRAILSFLESVPVEVNSETDYNEVPITEEQAFEDGYRTVEDIAAGSDVAVKNVRKRLEQYKPLVSVKQILKGRSLLDMVQVKRLVVAELFVCTAHTV